MLEAESEWILPENLRQQEKRETLAVDNGTFLRDGDFGAFYAYRRGLNFDYIKAHAAADDQSAT